MWGSGITQQQLQERILRLQTLKKVPGTYKENALCSEKDLQHTLTISRENEIASDLAFLSATTDDGLKVTAVCIEEHIEQRRMIVRIASNTGDLSGVTNGLRTLTTTLEKAATRG